MVRERWLPTQPLIVQRFFFHFPLLPPRCLERRPPFFFPSFPLPTGISDTPIPRGVLSPFSFSDEARWHPQEVAFSLLTSGAGHSRFTSACSSAPLNGLKIAPSFLVVLFFFFFFSPASVQTRISRTCRFFQSYRYPFFPLPLRAPTRPSRGFFFFSPS